MVTTPAQIRAARQLLGWRQPQLAKESGINLTTLKNIESGASKGAVTTIAAIEAALRRAGIELLEPGTMSTGKGRGVRLIVTTEC
jgi:transcriptional regulator with XRE-family HTH domain